MTRRSAALVTALLAATSVSPAAEIIKSDFGGSRLVPWLKLGTETSIADGLLHTRAQDNWQRGGLNIGPLPLRGNAWVIEYDFRPVAFGAQCQEFVSQTPSTHWYMCYVRPDGKLTLHTRAGGKWEARGSSTEAVKVGEWYHVWVSLTARSIRYHLSLRGKMAEPLWDTGVVPVDDMGRETTCALVDESAEAVGATEWDNLSLSTDSTAVLADMVRLRQELEAQERREAQARATGAALRRAGVALIPMPQYVTLTGGTLTLASDTVILPDPGDPRARAHADLVQGVIQERLGLWLPTGTDGPAGAICLQLPDKGEKVPWRGDQGYRLEVGDTGIILQSATTQGFYYAAQTLCQLAGNGRRLPRCRLTDWPAIPQRLAMVAVSQGAFQVIDVEYWKRMIRELAAVKINCLMPFEEGGTFAYEKYPFLGLKGRDGFTVAKGRLLSAYAKQRFVQLIPQQEMLGHMGSVLVHEELKDIRETGDVVCSSNPQTFAFLGDLMDDLCRMFPDAKYIHIGGDEFGHGFAQCPLCKARADKIGKPALYAEHLTKLREMCRARNRGMMIWWHEEGYTEQAADRLAKDIAVFDWHYGNQASYPSLDSLLGKGFKQTWATPAVTRYYGSRNDWDETFGNITGFLAAGVRKQVPGECTCTWVHGVWGGRNLFELNYYGLVLSGNCAWNPAAADYADFRWRFGRHWFGLPATGDGSALERDVLQAYHTPFGEGQEQRFWSKNAAAEEMLAVSLRATAEEIAKTPELVAQAAELQAFCDRADAVLKRWEREATRNQVTVKYLGMDVHIHATLARRIALTDRLMKLQAEARTAAPEALRPKLEALVTDLRALVDDYRRIEALFDSSVKEAGGGQCGWGGWYPYVAGGGVMFRAPQGRGEVLKQTAHLEQALRSEALPTDLFAP